MIKKVRSILYYIILALLLIILVYPIFMIISMSLKTSAEIQTNSVFALPETFYIGNYIRALEQSNLLVYYKNSLIVTSASVLMILCLSSMAAFAIAKMKFRGSEKILNLFLMGITIPTSITLLPLFIIFRNMKLINTHISLILPMVGFALPMSIYLFVVFYAYIPDSLLESAIIDGATVTDVFLKLIVPLSKNTFLTVAMTNVIGIWNEFMFSNTFISDVEMKTLPVGLYDFVGFMGSVDWTATFAAISMSVMPILLVYFMLNKYITNGVIAGAVKG